MPRIEHPDSKPQEAHGGYDSWFEYFMERLGMLTMRLMRSPSQWRRWCGTLLGALSVCLMLPLLAHWWCLRVAKQAARRVLRWFR